MSVGRSFGSSLCLFRIEEWNSERMEDWVRPASVYRTCLPTVVYEGGAESVKEKGRKGKGKYER